MRKNAWTLLLVLLVTSNVENSAGVCVNVKNRVSCTAITELSNVTLSSIQNIGSVKEIETRNNSELNLFANAFKSSVNLEKVFINDNKINKIYPDTFKDLPLTHVSLQYNGIHTIFPGAFLNLSNIVKIYMKGNNLKAIPKGVFTNLPLKELTLSHNDISSIENMALENLPNLTKLRLDHNKLQNIFINRILSNPEQLEILWLHNNSLTMITNYMLQKLTNLKVLNIGFNSISVIEPNSFEQTPSLGLLVLTHNLLKAIDGNIFPTLGHNHLQKLYLDNNKLMFLSSNFFSRLNALQKITIVGNPWLCPCLTQVQTFLAHNHILEKCSEDYNTGDRPICVSETDVTNVCRYTYNESLAEIFERFKKSHPLYKPALSCIL